jgi:DNA-binding response OmpR family regulator
VAGERVLIIEDDEGIGSELERMLLAQGYDAVWARDGNSGRDLIGSGVDLTFLDLGLPDVDGVTLCRELRRTAPDMLIVALTARTAELDVINTLEAGADDYLTKPFRLSELLARLRAHLRRHPAGAAAEVSAGSLTLNRRARTADVGDRALHLRPKEFDLLAALATRHGFIVNREDLMSEVWDEHWAGSTKTLDVHIAALRRKLARCEGAGYIVTTRGRGYRYFAAS